MKNFMSTAQHENSWTTADNQKIRFSQITHQHWSNIYWYHLIFQDKPGMPVYTMRKIVGFAKTEIYKRFNGEILEWRPIFSYEITWLQELGMLKGGTAITDMEGNKIGNILTCPVKIIQGFE